MSAVREAELMLYLDTATKAISDAWAALGYRTTDAPGVSLAEAIRQQLEKAKG